MPTRLFCESEKAFFDKGVGVVYAFKLCNEIVNCSSEVSSVGVLGPYSMDGSHDIASFAVFVGISEHVRISHFGLALI